MRTRPMTMAMITIRAIILGTIMALTIRTTVTML